MTRAALGAAPFSKLMYSSDGTRIPELHWLGALEGRRVLTGALGELVQDGEVAIRADVVMVQFDYAANSTRALTEEERAHWSRYLEPAG